MKDIVPHTRRFKPAVLGSAEETLRSFTASGRALFLFFAGLLIVSTVGLLYLLESSLVVPAPARGGELHEGILGSPRFINPVLAISDADRDATALLYSGLLHSTADQGYVADLAASYDISPDGTTYTFTIREGATFHDGEPVTAEDVVFTIQKTQRASLKSPVRGNWDGVVVEAPDTHTVRFVLKQAYSPFIKNATMGILPKHLWEGVSDEEFPWSALNVNPIGSGPYYIRSIERSPGGVPSSYTLAAFNNYALGKPYISELVLHFFQNEESLTQALEGGTIEAASGLSPATLSQVAGTEIRTAPLNRVFGVFFNQNQSEVLRDTDIRAALSAAIDRTDLVQSVLGGYGTPLTTPLPPSVMPEEETPTESDDRALLAQQMLTSDGWKLQDGVLVKTTGTGANAKTTTLEFSLATGNVPELRAAAQYVKREWERMGARVTLEVYEQGDLAQNVIRPRKYDALLFGEVVGRELDLYAFWHSSQRNDPGLNIALYANAAADRALTGLRETTSPEVRHTHYSAFLAELAKDIPAVFLYAPDFVYTVPNDLSGMELSFIETPSDRFLSVATWHREVDYVWPIFK